MQRMMVVTALAIALGAMSGTRSHAADLPLVKVATIPSDTGSDVYYAQDQGFFKAAGIDVQIDIISNGPDIIGGISGGSYGAGAASTVAIAAAHQHGIPIVVIAPGAVHAASVQTDLLMVGKDSPIHSARDLNGKTVAVTTLQGLGAVAIQAWILKNGGDLKTIRFVETRYPVMAVALAEGRVDAAQMTEPFITAAKGTVRLLADDYNAIANRFLIDGWVSSEAWVAQHPDEARRFALAMRNAHEWANAHHRESAAILVKYSKLDPDIAANMARAGFGLTLDAGLLQPLLDASVKFGALPKSIAASELLWPARP
jgi:NitT/TauT family transport system substrate-binding protein